MSSPFAGSLEANVWRVWGDYWTDRGQSIPPIRALRKGAGNDVFFVVALSDSELAAALPKISSEIQFRQRGDWVSLGDGWFGHWTVFSASWVRR